MLAFTSVYFSESSLFNRLQAIGIKKFLARLSEAPSGCTGSRRKAGFDSPWRDSSERRINFVIA